MIFDALRADARRESLTSAIKAGAGLLRELVEAEAYLGEVFALSYSEAAVLIHDFYRQQVGGIPALSFLIATRLDLKSGAVIDVREEDASVILLRVMDHTELPNSQEAARVRVENARRVSGHVHEPWDGRESMDAMTHNLLSFAGLKCRVVGTFYVAPSGADRYELRFGSDISNYYPNKGLKVFKPRGDYLARIVNFRSDPDPAGEVPLGRVRYASTNRQFQQVGDVKVNLSPRDLLAQKTALFGMTRSGKSNTKKIIAKSVFELRWKPALQRIGQVIFDPNGEYANENVQDQDDSQTASALRNAWRLHGAGDPDDVVVYGLRPVPHDPDRRLMLLNFYREENLQLGKEIINSVLERDESKYVKAFCGVDVTPPDDSDRSSQVRYERRLLFYRAMLHTAGFDAPRDMRAIPERLFNKDLLAALAGEAHHTAAKVLAKPTASWDEVYQAGVQLEEFLRSKAGQAFDNQCAEKHPLGRTWTDVDLMNILGMYRYRGHRLLADAREQHSSRVGTDYAQDIYADLRRGKLVIVDQSIGSPDLNSSTARRVLSRIFFGNQAVFREGELPPEIIVYVEEAHNLLPPSSSEDTRDIWVRAAKEGAKYRIGMVYATQEVSSIQRNILKNTANWFIGHLNNTDETRELRKFYDFADFESSILRSQDPGFVRMKTLSNPYVVPVQIDRFSVDASGAR